MCFFFWRSERQAINKGLGSMELLWMEEILHQLLDGLSHYPYAFNHPFGGGRICSIHNMRTEGWKTSKGWDFSNIGWGSENKYRNHHRCWSLIVLKCGELLIYNRYALSSGMTFSFLLMCWWLLVWFLLGSGWHECVAQHDEELYLRIFSQLHLRRSLGRYIYIFARMWWHHERDVSWNIMGGTWQIYANMCNLSRVRTRTWRTKVWGFTNFLFH